jgi:hypothetical protein
MFPSIGGRPARGHLEGASRTQPILFPEALDDDGAEANPALMKRRNQMGAPPVGTITPWPDQGACLMNGLEKVRAELPRVDSRRPPQTRHDDSGGVPHAASARLRGKTPGAITDGLWCGATPRGAEACVRPEKQPVPSRFSDRLLASRCVRLSSRTVFTQSDTAADGGTAVVPSSGVKSYAWGSSAPTAELLRWADSER